MKSFVVERDQTFRLRFTCLKLVSDMEEADSQLAQELDRRERAALKLQEQKEFERLQVSGNTSRLTPVQQHICVVWCVCDADCPQDCMC